jgi:small-conductance mechanosensitive channel
MRALQKTAATVLLASLAAAAYGIWATYQPPPPELGKQEPVAASGVDTAIEVDERTLRRAQRLSALATAPEELTYAQAATQLADHELDVAFAAALRQIEAHPLVLSPEAQQISDRLQKSQKQLESDQAQVDQLTAGIKQANDAQKSALQDRLDLAQSQLELDKDEVAAANHDLMQAGGNVHQRIQKMMQDHTNAANSRAAAAAAAPAADPLSKLHGLAERIREWLALRKKQRFLQFAALQATSTAAQLGEKRQQLAAQLETSKSSVPGHNGRPSASTETSTAAGASPATSASVTAGTSPAPTAAASKASPSAAARAATPAAGKTSAAAQTAASAAGKSSAATQAAAPAPGKQSASGQAAATAAATPNSDKQTQPAAASGTRPPDTAAPNLLATTRQLAADQRVLTSLDERISDRRQLADVYGKWHEVIASQATTVLHAGLLSITTVIIILLLLVFADQWLERLVGRMKLDRRQVETLRSVARVSLQILGIVVILLLLIGMPTQLGTMLGIVGAGLTVALKDFLVAFIGWLVLMGKNGMRLGDWVEINGVSGEVIELGMFHTVLLETGNWTDAGHPTGRRVTFTNSFAISGHYFNFSTSGQWLWDEVLVVVPYDRDAHPIAETLYKEVVSATTDSSKLAEQEWKSSAPNRRGAQITATAGLSIRPAVGGGGVEVAVRYVTRASERFNVRAKLYKSAVELLGQSAAPRAASA